MKRKVLNSTPNSEKSAQRRSIPAYFIFSFSSRFVSFIFEERNSFLGQLATMSSRGTTTASKTGSVKGVANFKRRSWDSETYRKRALKREDEARSGTSSSVSSARNNNNKRPAEFLQTRKEEIKLDAHVGRAQHVDGDSLGRNQPGFYCSVCDITLKDSSAYLDHVNSEAHQSRLGFSMRVQKSSVAAVQEQLKKSIARACEGKKPQKTVAEQRTEMANSKDRQKRARIAQKKADAKAKEDRRAEVYGAENPEMLRMMGFGSFGKR